MGRETTWGVKFYVLNCASCSMAFAIPNDFDDRRRKDQQSFYCPAGHSQSYTGKTEEQKLREQLQRKQQDYEAQMGRASLLERQRDEIKRAHQKMRERVRNGVCPCCNRTFTSFGEHMRNEHPEFGREKTFKVLRDAFGLTQSAVAEEIGVPSAYVSLYEREKPTPGWAVDSMKTWIEEHTGEHGN